MDDIQIVKPDATCMEIVKLWLERLPIMNEAERKVAVLILQFFSTPLLIVETRNGKMDSVGN